jgi:hypothetical protein
MVEIVPGRTDDPALLLTRTPLYAPGREEETEREPPPRWRGLSARGYWIVNRNDFAMFDTPDGADAFRVRKAV